MDISEIIEKHRLWLIGENGGSRADLRGAVLRGAVLRGTDLSDADLRGAVLRGTDLSDADLRGADLRGAVLRGADLRGADLRGAVLRGAVLSGADLSGAVLSDADLSDADLSDTNLSDTNLWSTVGNKAQVKSLQIEKYDVAYTKDVMQIGCQRHALSEWWAFSDEEIDRMDTGALAWWRKWGLTLRGIVEASPAE